jgi:hypothetical protein
MRGAKALRQRYRDTVCSPACMSFDDTKEAPMTQSHFLPITLLLLICAGLPACGTSGKTSPFLLDLDLPKDQKAVSDIRIASVAMDPDAAILNVEYVKPWNHKFSPDDLRNIEQSLRDTIVVQLPATIRSTGPRLDVHLMIRRYMVSVSEIDRAVLANVTWAATDSKGQLIYHEQFYASDGMAQRAVVKLTSGLFKESVHKAIVRRIATTSLALAAGPAAAKARPTTFDNTYTSFDEAASRLPQTMRVAMRANEPCSYYFRSLPPCNYFSHRLVPWSRAMPPQDFDWKGYLEALYKK